MKFDGITINIYHDKNRSEHEEYEIEIINEYTNSNDSYYFCDDEWKLLLSEMIKAQLK